MSLEFVQLGASLGLDPPERVLPLFLQIVIPIPTALISLVFELRPSWSLSRRWTTFYVPILTSLVLASLFWAGFVIVLFIFQMSVSFLLYESALKWTRERGYLRFLVPVGVLFVAHFIGTAELMAVYV